MNKQMARKSMLGMVGLFSAAILANIGSPSPVDAATSQGTTTVTSAQPAAAAKVAEAAIALTNQHANLGNQEPDNHEMGDGLSDAALKAATDESKSTAQEHVMQAPASLTPAQAADWLKLAKAAANADYAKTGRAQKIIQVAATTATIKSFAIGASDVPDVDAVDVASYQSWMTQANYNTLKAEGVQSAIVKLSEGSTYMNPYAKAAIKYAKNAGLQVGVYHYARFNDTGSAVKEANKVITSMRSLGLAKSTRIFADMEDGDTAVAGVQANLNQFWATLNAAGYTNHAVYTGGGQGPDYAAGVAGTVGSTKTWYAAYPYTPTATSTLASFKGLNYGAWQFSSAAYLAGNSGKNLDVSDDYSGVLTDLGSTTNSSSTNSNNSSSGNTAKAQGPWLSKSGYIKVTSPNYGFWSSFNFTSSIDSAKYNGQELVVNGMYHHQNGSTYYSVYTKAGQWLGYLNAKSAKWEGEQGAWHADDRYVTITHQYDVYGDFNFTKKYRAGTLMGNTYHATGKYYHMNGSTYLSLYRADGTWVGYINQKAVTATDQYGAWQSKQGYITFDEAGKTAYRDLAHQTVANKAATLAGHTYRVTGEYRAFSGKVQYSVYTLAGRWLGYVDAANSSLTSNPQGQWVAHNGYFTTTVKGQKIWSGFDYHSGKSTTTYYQNTYKINGEYFHSNGSKYYSLYDNAGKWMGYVNALNGSETTNAGGAWLKNDQTVKITTKGYPIWRSFFDKQAGSTSSVYGKTYRATGKYHHYNGAWYDSLYSGKTWLGYVNVEALTVQ
ncbi:GH25 family lysozyme [Lacticaseibacillus jixiensis]|uniref:GH25 family lysozyme n=1 Tax=Lacticaseibacillus jixiensis TaxID=3231926 RepID=UPI0036F40781